MTYMGLMVPSGTPAEFKARVDTDFHARGKIIREVGLKAD